MSCLFVIDKRSVSPVISVVLMVAIVLIIAAAIGSTVLGIGGSLTDSPPQATITTDQGTQIIEDPNSGDSQQFITVTLTHEGGDDINKEEVQVYVDGEPAYATLNPADEFYIFTRANLPHVLNPWDSTESDSISTGDKTIIVIATSEFEEEGWVIDDIGNDITFNPDGGDQAITIWTTESGPQDRDMSDVEIQSGDTVRMVWESGDRSVPLVEHEVT